MLLPILTFKCIMILCLTLKALMRLNVAVAVFTDEFCSRSVHNRCDLLMMGSNKKRYEIYETSCKAVLF